MKDLLLGREEKSIDGIYFKPKEGREEEVSERVKEEEKGVEIVGKFPVEIIGERLEKIEGLVDPLIFDVEAIE